jgi:hypothetical protein
MTTLCDADNNQASVASSCAWQVPESTATEAQSVMTLPTRFGQGPAQESTVNFSFGDDDN